MNQPNSKFAPPARTPAPWLRTETPNSLTVVDADNKVVLFYVAPPTILSLFARNAVEQINALYQRVRHLETVIQQQEQELETFRRARSQQTRRVK